MDILNFISWIKRGDYKATLPTDTTNLIAIGSKDPNRDDTYRPIALNAAALLPLYDKGTVTQTTSATTAVTLNTHSGIVTTTGLTNAANANTTFTLTNSKIKADSRIFLQAQYGGAGTIVLETQTIAAGSCTIRVHNSGTATLNALVKIHFMILN